MNTIQFTALVGPDGAIHPPAGVKLPEGEIVVSVSPYRTPVATLEERLAALCDRRGFSPETITDEIRAILLEDLACEDRGVPSPRPGPGVCKGSILYMAPDFDAPMDDMKEYME